MHASSRARVINSRSEKFQAHKKTPQSGASMGERGLFFVDIIELPTQLLNLNIVAALPV